MTDAEPVHAPLLNSPLGSSETEFVLGEHLAPLGPGGTPRGGIPLHRHRMEDEAWYVLEGTLRFQYGTQEFDASAGAGVLLTRGIPHTFWNPGPAPARYLLITGPKTAGLLEVLHRPVPPSPEGMKTLYETFEIDLLE